MNYKTTARGFTLIELLIVIAILAVLGVAVVLILNPAELIRQGRDSTRISDIATLNSAIAFYLSDVPLPDLGACDALNARLTADGISPFTVHTGKTVVDLYGVGGSGWVDINFKSISVGSPIAKVPRDPVNSTSVFYAYACNDTGNLLEYEIDANMESGKYQNTGGSDVESKDGGDNPNWYEAGNRFDL